MSFAKMIQGHHAGVIALWRAIEPDIGEYGEPEKRGSGEGWTRAISLNSESDLGFRR